MANIGTCRLCKTEGTQLIKAHIIPRAFFNSLQEKGKADTYKLSGEKARRLQNAWYDPEILCNDCEEKVMHPLDDYVVGILRDKKGSFSEVIPGGNDSLLIFEGIDRFKMRAFLASLLWRLSVSNQKEIQNVCIGGCYEGRISEDLLKIKDIGLEVLDEVTKNGMFSYIDAIVFSLLDHAHAGFFTPSEYKIPILDKKRDFQPVNGWWVNMPYCQMLISLDKRRHPARLYLEVANLTTASSLHPESRSEPWVMFQLDKCEETIKIMHRITSIGRAESRR